MASDAVQEVDVAHDVGPRSPVLHVVQDADLVVDDAGQDPQVRSLNSAHDLVPLASNLYPGLAVEHGHLPPHWSDQVDLRGNQR